jgi:hypothetical protein
MNNDELVQSLNNDLALQLPAAITSDAIQEKLAAFINNLINTNFERLISLLYRIDISEAKLKSLLHNSPGKNAGDIIAALIIERQLQKIKLRQQNGRNNTMSEEEKW